MNHNDTLLERVRLVGNTDLIKNERAKLVYRSKLLDCLNIRLFNNIPQKVLADYCNVSLKTIQRFEKFEIDSVILFLNYRDYLKDLPFRDKQKKLMKFL